LAPAKAEPAANIAAVRINVICVKIALCDWNISLLCLVIMQLAKPDSVGLAG